MEKPIVCEREEIPACMELDIPKNAKMDFSKFKVGGEVTITVTGKLQHLEIGERWNDSWNEHERIGSLKLKVQTVQAKTSNVSALEALMDDEDE
jgi:hypothetical protein